MSKDPEKSTEQDVAFIRALADLLRESDLTEIEVHREYSEDSGLKVRLTKTAAASRHEVALPVAPPAHAVARPALAVAEEAAHPPSPPAPAPRPPLEAENTVTSPMVGTAYLAPEPGAANFVAVGDTVSEGQTIAIIEAMKTMNQIPAPRDGTVRQILVSNAEPVEYGEALMVIS